MLVEIIRNRSPILSLFGQIAGLHLDVRFTLPQLLDLLIQTLAFQTQVARSFS